MWHHGEVIESFLDEKTNDAIRVEDEIGSLGVFVSYHGEESYQLWSLSEDVNVLLVDRAGDGGCGLLSFWTV